MSRLRARCPECGTLTAVALGTDYQCHSCGRDYGAATVRVEGTPELALPYPEAAVAAADDPDLEGILPQLPIVLGGDEAFHGRVREALRDDGEYVLARRPEELALPTKPPGIAGVGVTAAVATPANAAAIVGFLAALGL